MRRAIAQLLRYAGLLLGVCLALTGLTGSLLIFDHALDESLTPALRVSPSPSAASLQSVLTAAEAAAPSGSELIRLDFARQPGSPHTVRFRGAAGAGGERPLVEASVDPASGRVLALREWGQYPMSWLYRLHYTLLAGDTGKTLVGLFGLCLLFFCISGLYLWWPRRGNWKRALSIEHRRGALRLLWDSHRVAGVIAVPVLCLSALTGIAMVFAQPTAFVVGSVLETRDVPSYSVEPMGVPLPPDTLIERALQHWPGSVLKRIYFPRAEQDSVRITLRLPGELWSNHGASSVWLDPYSGEVLGEWAMPHLPAGNRLLAWIFPLHNADALGLWARWLWIIAGLMPTLLFASGGWLWWRKRQR
jgi:uncharacterized iron-regulated membrane protein|tara:strand:- start:1518 stop:2600 length:1083 start_codon:yes stop_codon:yes gene_type:complete